MQLIRKIQERLHEHPVSTTAVIILPISDENDEQDKLTMRRDIAELDSRLRYIEQRIKIAERA